MLSCCVGAPPLASTAVQALHGHMSTGQGATADAIASATESGNAGQELVYLQVRARVQQCLR